MTKKENRIFNFLTGFYACGRCPACKQCRWNLKRRKDFTASVTNKNYQIKHFITCNTVGVIYMLECDCRHQYIGRTSRPMGVRIAEHVNNIKRCLITRVSQETPTTLRCQQNKSCRRAHIRGENSYVFQLQELDKCHLQPAYLCEWIIRIPVLDYTSHTMIK